MLKQIFLVLSIVTVFWAQTVPSSEQPFTITISGPTEVKTGAGVEIKIRLTNISNHELKLPVFWSNGLDTSYMYDVHDYKGNSVEKKNKGRFTGSVWETTVQPGKNLEDEILVSKIFEINKPGQYVVQVSRNIFNEPKGGIVKSNSITINVVP